MEQTETIQFPTYKDEKTFEKIIFQKTIKPIVSDPTQGVDLTFVHSLCIRGGKPTPLHIGLIGVVYVAWEAYIVCAYHAKYAHYSADHVTSIASLAGLSLFFVGFLTHVHSDHILRNLRKPGETDYKIPRGGLFAYVSTPNYLGESIMWTGFALWYLEKFDDYPKNRKAFIPFVL